jgi:superoxide dismutase, Cu-Zn family
MMIRRLTGLLCFVALTAGCIPIVLPGETVTSGHIVRYDNVDIGQVSITDEPRGSRFHIVASGLPPGIHGVHVHAVGHCAGTGFAAAGAHWNPTHRQHGHDNPAGYHAGDLGNIRVGPDGRVDTDLIATDVRLRGDDGGKGLVISDHDGATLIIHALPDDEHTDPSGNSGNRIACAVLAMPQQP